MADVAKINGIDTEALSRFNPYNDQTVRAVSQQQREEQAG